jgi:hypothetical protein
MASLLICLWLPATVARAADWEWIVAPYVWGSDISLDVTANNEPVLDGDLDFSDLLDKIDFAAMVHFEGSSGKAGFYVDVLALSTSDDQKISANPPLPGGTEVSSDVDTEIYEAGGFYRLLSGDQIFDVLLGARLIEFDQKNDIDLPSPSTLETTVELSKSFLDVVLGARYGRSFGKRWDLVVLGNVSTGDTELTWNALATLGIRLGKTDRYGLRFGWRHMDIDIEETDDGVDIETDLVLSGPAAAFTFRF